VALSAVVVGVGFAFGVIVVGVVVEVVVVADVDEPVPPFAIPAAAAVAAVATADEALVAAVAAVWLVLELVPVRCWPNGSRAEPVSRDCAGVDWTLSAGSEVPVEGGGVDLGACATGVAADDFERAIGTATIATSSATAAGQSRFSRSSLTIRRSKPITVDGSKSTFIAQWVL
jgi:hypothetical protein